MTCLAGGWGHRGGGRGDEQTQLRQLRHRVSRELLTRNITIQYISFIPLLFDFMLVFRRLEGFGGSDRGPGVADLADYPGFAKQQVPNFPRNFYWFPTAHRLRSAQ